jgi:predicted house-cleaning noncanonical NTP pyrophosphatase (MazG superfamily)
VTVVTPTEFIVISVLLALSWIFPGEGFDMREDEPMNMGPSVPKRNELEEMWDQQERFMYLLQEKRGFPEFPTDLTSKKGQQFLKDIRNHLMEELFEAGQHLKNAKSHRATEIPEVDREAYLEELVDALHLYLELVIASGITRKELVKAYLDKGRTNVERIRSGY